MQRIHRRKNAQIQKAFGCPQKCGKAYGSYAALYTHIKSKHPDSKPPQMKSTINPHFKKEQLSNIPKRAPKQMLKEGFKEYEELVGYDCKVCKKQQCICYEEIDQEEMDRTIMLFEDQGFIRFVDVIAKLNTNDITWARNTQDPYEFLNKIQVRQRVVDFCEIYKVQELFLPAKWLNFLSMSSRYWQPQNLRQLYDTIFAIISQGEQHNVEAFMKKRQGFAHMLVCIEQKPSEWSQFVEIIRLI